MKLTSEAWKPKFIDLLKVLSLSIITRCKGGKGSGFIVLTSNVDLLYLKSNSLATCDFTFSGMVSEGADRYHALGTGWLRFNSASRLIIASRTASISLNKRLNSSTVSPSEIAFTNASALLAIAEFNA